MKVRDLRLLFVFAVVIMALQLLLWVIMERNGNEQGPTIKGPMQFTASPGSSLYLFHDRRIAWSHHSLPFRIVDEEVNRETPLAFREVIANVSGVEPVLSIVLILTDLQPFRCAAAAAKACRIGVPKSLAPAELLLLTNCNDAESLVGWSCRGLYLRPLSLVQGSSVTKLPLRDLNERTWRLLSPLVHSVLRGRIVLFLGPNVQPVAAAHFISQFISPYVSELSQGSAIIGCQVAAQRRRQRYVVSHGIGVALGAHESPVLFERHAGFSVMDPRAHRESERDVAPSPNCFAAPVSVMRRHWRPVEPTTSEMEGVASPPVTQIDEKKFSACFTAALHTEFLDFVFTARKMERLRVLSLPSVVVGDFPGWSPIAGSESNEGLNVNTDFPPEFAARHSAFLHEHVPGALDGTSFLRGVSVKWDTFCVKCFGFTNEVMHFVRPLEEQLQLRLAIGPECFCQGTPSAFSSSLARLSAFKPFEAVFNKQKEKEVKRLPWNNGSDVTDRRPARDLLVWISHKDPGSFPSVFFDGLDAKPDIVVGRSMYEFTKVPGNWVSHQQDVDEIWVPSRFVHWVFRTSGFNSEKIYVVPEPIDVFYYCRRNSQPLVLPIRSTSRKNWRHASNVVVVENESVPSPATAAGPVAVLRDGARLVPREILRRNFKFLSVFKWEERKAWDILLEAFFSEFTAEDPVSLYIVAYIYGESGRSAKRMLEMTRRVAQDIIDKRDGNLTTSAPYGRSPLKHLGTFQWAQFPHVEIISEQLDEDDLLSLYRSCDAFVLPTRGEGWGLPIIQAMSMELPTIATNWSGNVDFMNEHVSYLLSVETLEAVPAGSVYSSGSGKVWAKPSLSHLRQLMRHVLSHRSEAREVGRRARKHIMSHFSEEAVAEKVKARLAALRDRHWDSSLPTAAFRPAIDELRPLKKRTSARGPVVDDIVGID